MKIIRIYPKTNFHTFLRSDTLWGNIIYAYKLLYGEDKLKELLKLYLDGKCPFRVSSTFPFEINQNANSKFTYYFPKPILGGQIINANDPEEMTILKKFKKIRYIEKRIFEDYINGNIDDIELYQMFKVYSKEMEKDAKNHDKKIIDANGFKSLEGLKLVHNLHNSIDRMSNSTLKAEGSGQLYWESEYYFGNEFGLFFLVEGEIPELIEAPIRLLSHIGIGGNRTIGKGSFAFEIDNLKLNIPAQFNAFVSLSLYQPNYDEIEAIQNQSTMLFYDITTRIGKLGKYFNTGFQEKNPVNCFVEGSTFMLKKRPIGSLVSTAKINNELEVYSNYLFLGIQANVRLQ